ncbi:hypothetical protein C8J57DRAFT_1470366 [Mycena rebaudengoi]|nr:hypothetical protein C8J57DRAFT_1470366 [Mycena rebaudengoi]
MRHWALIATAASLLGLHSVEGVPSLIRSVEQGVSSCCSILASRLPGKIFFPGTAAFDSQLTKYYSAEERALVSACRVNPATAQEVSAAVSILGAGNCSFAVVSGGHMFWSGASNIGAPGITIDLRMLTSYLLSADKKVVAVGPGLNFRVIYENLAQFNLTVVGARSNTVGVGGFLLGGGVSNLGPAHGFANDNIVGYQAVIANGQIVECSSTSNSDLFWALRAGSTNFGIVTQFNISTYSGGVMWGERERELSDAFIAFMKKLKQFPLGGASFISGFNGGQDTLVGGFAYLGTDGSNTELFSDMLAVQGIVFDSIRPNVNQVNISAEIDASFPPGLRTQWGTMTFRANTQLALDISEKGREVFAPFTGRPGFSYNIGYQSLAAPMLDASHAKNSPQGLSGTDGDLFLLNIFAYWNEEADDAGLDVAIREMIDYSNSEAEARGLWNPWIYLNYAFPGEAVYEGYGADNLARLKQIQHKYDPQGVFAKLWSGGFKIPK